MAQRESSCHEKSYSRLVLGPGCSQAKAINRRPARDARVYPSPPHATLKVGDPVSIVPRSVPSGAILLSPPAKDIALPIGLKPIRSEERIFAPAGDVEKYATICQPAIRLCVQLSAVGMHARAGCRHDGLRERCLAQQHFGTGTPNLPLATSLM